MPMHRASTCLIGILLTTVLLIGCAGGGRGLPSPEGRAATVEGTVSDAQGPIRDVVFIFAQFNGQLLTRNTDPNGFFTISFSITQTTTVTITASFGGQTATQSVIVSPGQTVVVNLTLGGTSGGFPPGPPGGDGGIGVDGPPPPPPL